jgi:hypothetical protein
MHSHNSIRDVGQTSHSEKCPSYQFSIEEFNKIVSDLRSGTSDSENFEFDPIVGSEIRVVDPKISKKDLPNLI